MLACSILPTHTPLRGVAPTHPPPSPQFQCCRWPARLEWVARSQHHPFQHGQHWNWGEGGGYEWLIRINYHLFMIAANTSNPFRLKRPTHGMLRQGHEMHLTEAPDAAQVHEMPRLMHKMVLVCTRCQWHAAETAVWYSSTDARDAARWRDSATVQSLFINYSSTNHQLFINYSSTYSSTPFSKPGAHTGMNENTQFGARKLVNA